MIKGDLDFEQIQAQRLRIILSIDTAKRVFQNFGNMNFALNTIKQCENSCYEKITKEMHESEQKDFKEYKSTREETLNCIDKCDDIYNKIMHHQIKSAEISNFTFSKHIKKCKELNIGETVDISKLLSCYEYKVNKLVSRFGSYYFNQRMNLISREAKQLEVKQENTRTKLI